MSAKKRLFLAVDLGPDTTAALETMIGKLRTTPGVRWVQPKNLHITVKFFGSVEVERIPGIEAVTKEIASTHGPFELEIAGTGCFPNPKRPRVLWVGIRQPEDNPLNKLVADIESAMSRLGFAAEERAYSPHVTIGRVERNGGIANHLASYEAANFGLTHIRELVLYESLTPPGGSQYIPVFKAKLKT